MSMKIWMNRHEGKLDILILVILFAGCTAISGWLFPRDGNTLFIAPRVLMLAPLVAYLWYRKIVPLTAKSFALLAFLPVLATAIAMITEIVF